MLHPVQNDLQETMFCVCCILGWCGRVFLRFIQAQNLITSDIHRATRSRSLCVYYSKSIPYKYVCTHLHVQLYNANVHPRRDCVLPINSPTKRSQQQYTHDVMSCVV